MSISYRQAKCQTFCHSGMSRLAGCDSIILVKRNGEEKMGRLAEIAIFKPRQAELHFPSSLEITRSAPLAGRVFFSPDVDGFGEGEIIRTGTVHPSHHRRGYFGGELISYLPL